jgi:hypothetical protein
MKLKYSNWATKIVPHSAIWAFKFRRFRRIIGGPWSSDGAVAQLGERRVRNAKVGSSILLGSTNSINLLVGHIRLAYSK